MMTADTKAIIGTILRLDTRERAIIPSAEPAE